MAQKLTYDTTMYQKKTAPFQQRYQHFSSQERNLLDTLGNADTTDSEILVAAAEARLNAISYLIAENTISWEIFERKNFRTLDAARKDCYRVFSHLEKVIDIPLDTPLSEVVKLQKQLSFLPNDRRFFLTRKMVLVLYLLKKSYGHNTKGAWNLTELEGRVATISCNLLDVRSLSAKMEPAIPGYQQRMQHYKLVTQTLTKVADAYRMKYELTSQSFTDLNQGIGFLSVAEKLLALGGDSTQAQEYKKRITVWTNHLHLNQKKK